jgi:UDP-N-acetylmuramyl pentapeptide phosphotransferase/UDP-N-acetylglucosamine-1-phosphate transferase
MSTLIVGFIASFLAGFLLLRYRSVHERFSADHDITGIQKFHVRPVPRIGGIALLVGIVATIAIIAIFLPIAFMKGAIGKFFYRC